MFVKPSIGLALDRNLPNVKCKEEKKRNETKKAQGSRGFLTEAVAEN